MRCIMRQKLVQWNCVNTLLDWHEYVSVTDFHTKAGGIGDSQFTFHWHWLSYKEIAKHRLNSFSIGACSYIFAESITWLACDKMIRIRAAAMWNNGRIIGGGVRCNAQRFTFPPRV